MQETTKNILKLLYPQRCPICGKIVKNHLICMECKRKISYVTEPRCMKCGKTLANVQVEYCFDCKRMPKSYERNLALVDYTEPVSKALAKVKYNNCRQNLDFFCEEIGKQYKSIIQQWNAQVLIPVPIHKSRRRTRGFNQAEEMGKRLEVVLGMPMECHMLNRCKKTLPQKELSDKQRLKNLEQAFIVSDAFVKRYHTVILLDDIYTTGSTAEACTRVLKGAGVKKVYMITIAIGKGM